MWWNFFHIFDKEHNKSLWQMSRVKISQNKASELYLSTVLKVNSAIFTQAPVFVCGKEMRVASGKNQQPLRVEAQQASEHLNLSPPTAVSVWRRALATASCHPRRTIFQLDWVSHFTCRGGCAAVLLWMLFSAACGINKEDGTGTLFPSIDMHHKQFIQSADGPAQTAVARRPTLAGSPTQVDNQMANDWGKYVQKWFTKFSSEFWNWMSVIIELKMKFF